MEPRRIIRGALQRAGLALCLLLTLPRPALATPKEEAAQHFAHAMELVREGRIQEGLDEFVRAYELLPHYAVLYNIGRAHADLGQPVQAVETLRRYLELGGQEIRSDRRENVEQDVERLESSIATIDVRVAVAGARVELDGEFSRASRRSALRSAPTPACTRYPPSSDGYRTASRAGDHGRRAAADRVAGAAAVRDDRAGHGGSRGVGAEADDTPGTNGQIAPGSRLRANPVDARSKGQVQRAAALAVGGAGLVAGGMGAGFAFHAWSKEREARRECGVGGDSLACTPRGLEANQAALDASSRAGVAARDRRDSDRDCSIALAHCSIRRSHARAAQRRQRARASMDAPVRST